MKLYEVNQQIEALMVQLEPDPETGEIPANEDELIEARRHPAVPCQASPEHEGVRSGPEGRREAPERPPETDGEQAGSPDRHP